MEKNKLTKEERKIAQDKHTKIIMKSKKWFRRQRKEMAEQRELLNKNPATAHLNKGVHESCLHTPSPFLNYTEKMDYYQSPFKKNVNSISEEEQNTIYQAQKHDQGITEDKHGSTPQGRKMKLKTPPIYSMVESYKNMSINGENREKVEVTKSSSLFIQNDKTQSKYAISKQDIAMQVNFDERIALGYKKRKIETVESNDTKLTGSGHHNIDIEILEDNLTCKKSNMLLKLRKTANYKR